MNKNYNMEDEKYRDLIKALKELPRQKARPDFEIDLKRRINALPAQKKKEFFFAPFFTGRRLIPAAAITFGVILLLIFISRDSIEKDNPFMASPPVRNESAEKTAISNKQGLLIKPENISSTDVVNEPAPPAANPVSKPGQYSSKSKSETAQVAASQKLRRSLRDLNYGNYGSNIDQSLREKPDLNNNGLYDNGGRNVSFDGFNLIPEDDILVRSMRARMDSLKKRMHEVK